MSTLAYDESCEWQDSLEIERRRGVRVRIVRPVRVFEPESGRTLAAKTRDISSSGAKLEMPIAAGMQPGQVVEIDVGAFNGLGSLTHRRQHLSAKIVWVSRDSRLVRPMLTAGLEFCVELDAAVRVA